MIKQWQMDLLKRFMYKDTVVCLEPCDYPNDKGLYLTAPTQREIFGFGRIITQDQVDELKAAGFKINDWGFLRMPGEVI